MNKKTNYTQILLIFLLLPVLAQAQPAADSARYMAIKGRYQHMQSYSALYYKTVKGADATKKGKDIKEVYGLVDHHFREVLPCKYSGIFNFTPGKFWVQDAVTKKCGIVDTHNKPIVPLMYTGVRHGDWPDRLWTVEQDSLWYPVDRNGKVWGSGGYGDIRQISANRYACRSVGTPDPGGQPGVTGALWAMSDTNGHILTPFKYLVISPFGNNHYVAESFGKHYLLDEQGKELNTTPYREMKILPNGLLFVMHEGLGGLMDMNGHLIMPLAPNYIAPLSTTVSWVQILPSRKWALLSNDGIPDTSRLYDAAGHYDTTWGNIQLVTRNHKFGAVNSRGIEVVPCVHERVYPFYNGIAIIVDNGRYGYIDSNGRQIAPCAYATAKIFGSHWGAMKQDDGKYVLVNKEGQVIDTSGYSYIGAQYGGISLVVLAGKSGYADSTGKLFIPAIYDQGRDFRYGLGPVMKNEKYGAVNKDGKMIVPFIYERVVSDYSNKYFFERNSWLYSFDAEGKVSETLPADIYNKSESLRDFQY